MLFSSRKWKSSLDNGVLPFVNWLIAAEIIPLFERSESQTCDLQEMLFCLIAFFLFDCQKNPGSSERMNLIQRFKQNLSFFQKMHNQLLSDLHCS